MRFGVGVRFPSPGTLALAARTFARSRVIAGASGVVALVGRASSRLTIRPVLGSVPVVTSASFSIGTNPGFSALVGTVTATNNPTSFAIISGNPSGFFSISSAGALRTGASAAPTDNNYSLSITATNSFGTSAPVTINVTVGAIPVVVPDTFGETLPASTGSLVGTVTVTSGTPTGFSITAGNSAGYFAINSAGDITVTSAGASGLTAQTYNLTVQATNALGSTTGAITVIASATSGNILHATTANFAAQVTAAANGDTILLADGNYGTWAGTNKSITIAPEPGASPVIGLNCNSTRGNFTIDGGHTEISESAAGMVRATSFTSPGIKMTGVTFTGSPKNITIKRCFVGPASFSGAYWNFSGQSALNLTVDMCYFTGLNGGEEVFLFDSSNAGATIKRCYFYNMNADAVRLGGGFVTVQDCEFDTVDPLGNSALHTDAIQFYGGVSCTIQRCFFHDCEQAIGAFDGTNNNLVEDCVVVRCTAHAISFLADNPASMVRHNTVRNNDIQCYSKSGGAISRTNIQNNLAGVSTSGAVNGQPVLLNNLSGTPTFVGGASPTTWAGFKLATGSIGKNAATDGGDVGARIP